MTPAAEPEPRTSNAPESRWERRFRSVWTHLFDVPHRLGLLGAGGVRTRFVQCGDPNAPPLIMLHGIAASLENFAANIGPLGERFNVYAIDMLGAGLTDKPGRPIEMIDYLDDVAAFMSAAGLKKASFMSVSLGSWVTAVLAARRPELVDKIILVAANGMLPIGDLGRGLHASLMQTVCDPTWENIGRRLEDLSYDEENRIDDIIVVRQRLYQQPGMADAVANIAHVILPGVWERNILPEPEWALHPVARAAHDGYQFISTTASNS
jgi:2-hydroxy-6-oxonona-2,4-dienedioate hydrolase